MNNNDIHAIIRILKKECQRYELPVVTKLAGRKDPFTVLVSTVLSARTKDNVTAEASDRLFRKAPDVQGLRKLTVKQIENLIYPVGFYKTKAKHLKALSAKLLDEYNGTVPDDLDELLTFPGVGRKTANLVMTLGFRKHGICVDTHVHRISNRFGYVDTKTPEQTEMMLRKKLDKKYWILYNDLLVAYGQNLCRPIGPHCDKCRIRRYCDFGRNKDAVSSG